MLISLTEERKLVELPPAIRQNKRYNETGQWIVESIREHIGGCYIGIWFINGLLDVWELDPNGSGEWRLIRFGPVK